MTILGLMTFFRSCNGVLAAVGIIAVGAWGWLQIHDSKVRVNEITRQETADAKTADRAHAAVHAPAARRVLDPSTDTASQ